LRAAVGCLKTAPGAAVVGLADALRAAFPGAPADTEADAAMTWDMARSLRDAGMEVGSHSRTHPVLTDLPAARLASEVLDSKRRLEEEMGGPVAWFCYPNGDYNAAVQRALAEAGYRAACSLEPGANVHAKDLMALRRINISEGFAQAPSGAFSESLFMAELAGVFDRLLLRRLRRP